MNWFLYDRNLRHEKVYIVIISSELSESFEFATLKYRLPCDVYLKNFAKQEYELHHENVELKKGELKVQQQNQLLLQQHIEKQNNISVAMFGTNFEKSYKKDIKHYLYEGL